MAESGIKNKWPMLIVVASGHEALLYHRENLAAELQRQQQLVSDDAQRREQALTSDDVGRSFDRSGPGRHRIEPPSSARQAAGARFVAQIALATQRAFDRQGYASLAIVAAPRVLGELRTSLKPPLLGHSVCELAKDLTSADAARICQCVDEEIERRGQSASGA